MTEIDGPRMNDMEAVVIKSAMENTNEGFVTIDRNHRIVFFNKAAEKIFGCNREEVLGHDLDVILSPGCSPDHRGAVEKHIKTGKSKLIGHAMELVAERKNGEKFHTDISFSESVVDGEPYFTGIVRDLSDTKLLLDQIKRAERLAALGQFVAEITHEIKNPLMMIGGFARQLLNQISDKKSRKKLQIIEKEISRLEILLKELGDYYLPKKLASEVIDISNLLRETCKVAEEDCRGRNIRFEFEEKNESEVINVRGDRDKLKQVFLNLMKNSIEAMEKGGTLSVSIILRNGSVEILVEDNGSGISESDYDRVFSPFFTTKRSGTGLGLSISKRIIEGHDNGSLTFKAKEGKGTTFKITMAISNVH